MKARTFRLSEIALEQLKEIADVRGETQTDAIRFAIQSGHDAIHKQPTDGHTGEGWAQTVTTLTEQLAVKDDQIASLGRALEAAQETAKAAQALHAANVQQTALASSNQKECRRWRWPWEGRKK